MSCYLSSVLHFLICKSKLKKQGLSDVWGLYNSSLKSLNQIFIQYLKLVLEQGGLYL